MNQIYKTDKIEAYYYDLNNTLLINEIALDKKLELLCEKFNQLKEVSKNEISFSKCKDKLNCTYCSYKIMCNRE
jgi:CRISPR/Cas system-associated exonuclease Cas4 (RecB family)